MCGPYPVTKFAWWTKQTRFSPCCAHFMLCSLKYSYYLLFWAAIFCIPKDYNLDTDFTVPNCVENWKRSLSVNGLHHPISYLSPALGQDNTDKWPLFAVTVIRSVCVPRWRTSGYRAKELKNTADSTRVKFNWCSTISTSTPRNVL